MCPQGPRGFQARLFFRQNIIAEHEIRNISCAAQDPEDLCTFAYITKDLQTSHHYCHVFSTVDVVGGAAQLGAAGRRGPRAAAWARCWPGSWRAPSECLVQE